MPHQDGEDKIDSNFQTMTEDGLILEGLGEGGVVEIVQKDRVDFFWDVAKYFEPTFLIIGAHLLYYTTGNWCILLLIGNLALIVSHFASGEENLDKRNLSRKSERLF